MEMDTPEKANEINASFATIEDSPVFSFINNLSPIKPVKSLCISQAYHTINFTSPPSIFSTPHVNSSKESRLLGRGNNMETCMSGVPCEKAVALGRHKDVVEGNKLPVIKKMIDSRLSYLKSSVNSSIQGEVSAIEPQPMLIEHCERQTCGSGPTCESSLSSTIHCHETSAIETLQTGFAMGQPDTQGIYPADQAKHIKECDWDTLMMDSTDLLFYDSPSSADDLPGKLNSNEGVCVTFNGEHKMRVSSFGKTSEVTETDFTAAQCVQTSEIFELDQKLETEFQSKELEKYPAVKSCVGTSSMSAGLTNLCRGMRRRCLDFEMAADSGKSVIDAQFNPNDSFQSDANDDQIPILEDQTLISNQSYSEQLRHSLPGIGLHLNALAITAKESRPSVLETIVSPTNFSDALQSFQSPSSSQLFSKSSLTSVEIYTQCSTNMDSLLEDPSQACTYGSPEDANPLSPKKKRRKFDGEGDSCKRCNCKKSKCLKLYCECFAAGVYCIDSCSCQDCFNKPIHEDTVLATRKQIESRNPLAFAPKVIRSAESATDIGDETSTTPASARHKRGCNCKKSNCLKKYCECFQGGVGCSIGCRCEGCKNTFGRKDASLETETCREDDGEEANENQGIDQAMKTENFHEGYNPNSSLPMTPISLSRTLAPSQCSSQSKPQRILSIGSSSGIYGQLYGKPNIILSQSTKQFQSFPDDEIPAMLQSNYSTSPTVKSSSPNSKRVSPPQTSFGSSPSLRSGRKLILQSIPSFPSLTPQH